ncbi:hypothetical protein DI09_233p20 [Mitosporidium daphniae]|uniref:Uncharacterized protein n=1 Tax=Mitosporidium daphniae TaxID=1485682 RepID=A0A098VSM3_9MICR|nr:uncharacterized protein DI09_233p20 [Mitosporidium daphniae]KGG51965.1 hypothetical protein DI09_233p20 [Mitosporidium daphniae]|eukprot:XP_013238401.1 uncharacterized protein DI09_233p20 [Mitosporidium daphniae]
MKIKPPPSDRLWYGFYEMPKMELSIEPLVSTRAIKWSLVTSVIEKRLNESMEEYFVLPNMEELGLPPMKSRYEDEQAGIRSDEGIKHPLHQPDRSYASVEATSLTSALMSLPRKRLLAQQQLKQKNPMKPVEISSLPEDTKQQATKGSNDEMRASQHVSAKDNLITASRENYRPSPKDESYVEIDKSQPPPLPPPRISSKGPLKQRRSSFQTKPNEDEVLSEKADTDTDIHNPHESLPPPKDSPEVPEDSPQSAHFESPPSSSTIEASPQDCPTDTFSTRSSQELQTFGKSVPNFSVANRISEASPTPIPDGSFLSDSQAFLEPIPKKKGSLDDQCVSPAFQEDRQLFRVKKSNSTSQLVNASETAFPSKDLLSEQNSSSYDELNLTPRSSRIATEHQSYLNSTSSSSSSSVVSANGSTQDSASIVQFKRMSHAGGIMKTLRNSVKTIYNYPTSVTGTKSKIRSLWHSSSHPPLADKVQSDEPFQSQHHRRYYSSLSKEAVKAKEKDEDPAHSLYDTGTLFLEKNSPTS